MSQKNTSPSYFLNNCVKNQPILIIFDMLNPEKIRHEHHTDLSMSPVTTLLLEIQKSLFQQFRLFMLAQEKTNSNCRTVALAVYLLLFSASYYLHSHSTTGGATTTTTTV